MMLCTGVRFGIERLSLCDQGGHCLYTDLGQKSDQVALWFIYLGETVIDNSEKSALGVG